ncbi:MAG: hypothetical protein ACRC28_11265 [Clostridium sp.]
MFFGTTEEEFLEKLKQNRQYFRENQYMTMDVEGQFGVPSIYYTGEVELEAYRHFRKLKGKHRRIVKADILSVDFLDSEMILEYDIKEIIEDSEN